MATRDEDFEVRVHDRERLIEVIYPSHPTLPSYERYDKAIREQVLKLGGSWDCLVDQRALTVLPPEVSERVVKLNGWAKTQGMRRTARVLKASAMAELQVRRLVRDAGVKDAARIFTSREDAWNALRRDDWVV